MGFMKIKTFLSEIADSVAKMFRRQNFLPRLPLVLLCCIANVSFADPYTVMPGDVLRMRIMGIPDLSSESSILSDGSVEFPLIGRIDVQGLTTEEIQAEVTQRLLNTDYTDLSDGNTLREINLAGFQTFIEIGRYRPIYLDGFVSEPGQAEFEPGMSIRVAILRAGGVTTIRGNAGDNNIGIQSLAESHTRAIDVAVLMARQWYLEALSSGDPQTPFPDIGTAPVRSVIFNQLLQAERLRVTAELDAYELRQLAILSSIEEKEALLTLYDQLIAAGNELERADEESAKRLQALEERGLTRGREVDNARRLLALSRAENLDGKIGQLTVQQRMDELQQQLRHARQEFDLEIAIDFARVLAELLTAQSRLQSSQILAGTALSPQPEYGLEEMSITVFRAGERLKIGEDLTLNEYVTPGDIITVIQR